MNYSNIIKNLAFVVIFYSFFKVNLILFTDIKFRKDSKTQKKTSDVTNNLRSKYDMNFILVFIYFHFSKTILL